MKRSATNNLELETAALNGNVERVRLLLKSVDSQTVFKVINRLEYIIWMGELTDQEERIEEKLLKCLELMIPKLDVNVTYNDKSLANEMLGLLHKYNKNKDYGLREPIEKIIKSIVTNPKFVNTNTVILASRLNLIDIIPLFNKEQINQTFEGTTPLKEALGGYSKEMMIEILINNGANVNAKDDEGKTPLLYALEYSSLLVCEEVVDLLIKNGADVKVKDNGGKTALMFLCRRNRWWTEGYEKTFLLLIEKGVDVSAKDNEGKTAFDNQMVFKFIYYLEDSFLEGELSESKQENILECLKIIISVLDVNVTYNNVSLERAMLYLLHEYNKNEDYGLREPIESIIKSIVTNPKFVNRNTVILASRLNLTDIIHLFNKEQTNQMFKGRTPLKEAIERDFTEMIEILIQNGADVNAKDDEGKTPLLYALEYSSLLVCEILIQNGADVNAKDNEGKTALDYAETGTDIKLLLENGATEASDKTKIKPIIDSFIPRFEQQQCAICLNNFDESAIRLPCGHGFHKECIVEWFKINNECPQCRMKIDQSLVDAFASLTLVRDNTWKLKF